MAFPVSIPTPKPPPPRDGRDDFTDLERLDRSELDDAPDTDPEPAMRGPLPTLDWEEDGESGVKRRARDYDPAMNL